MVPFYLFVGEDSPTKIDDRKKGTLILTSLLEDLEVAPLNALKDLGRRFGEKMAQED